MKYIIDVPASFVDITNGLHIPMDKQGNFRIDTGLKLIPYTEPDYRKSIEDKVWELADYMCRMSQTERCLCFGFSYPSEVTINLSYQEAKAKFEAWLKQKDEICVGDEVLPMDTEYDTMIVTRTWKDDYDHACVDTIGYDGRIYCFLKCKVKKTGRHFPEVDELLKKMRDTDED